MRIGPLTRSEVAAAKRVIATVVVEYYFQGRYTADELLARYEKTGYLADLDRLEEEYDGRRGLLLGVFDGEDLVGTGGIRQIDPNTGELVRLWLLRDFRGRGFGRKIADALLKFGRAAHWQRVQLDTSWHCQEAVALFRKLGFREIERYKESIGDCFMQLDFPQPTNEPQALSRL